MKKNEIDKYLKSKGEEFSIICIIMTPKKRRKTNKKFEEEKKIITTLFKIYYLNKETQDRDVLMAVRRKDKIIESKRFLEKKELEGFPHLNGCIELRTAMQRIYIYCTHNTHPFIYKKYIDKLYSKIAKDGIFIVLGLFNLVGIDWEKNESSFCPIDYGSAKKNRKHTKYFLKKMDDLDLSQLWNGENNALDLVYTNRSDICKLKQDKNSDEVKSFWLEIELSNHVRK